VRVGFGKWMVEGPNPCNLSEIQADGDPQVQSDLQYPAGRAEKAREEIVSP